MKKRKSSIKLMIMLPVIVLGLVAIISSITAIMNIQNVNDNASLVTDEYMVGIQELSSIQDTAKEIHTLSLSHIIATDFETKIAVIEKIKATEEELDAKIIAYKKYVSEDELAVYEEMLSNYEQFKNAIVYLAANSADSKTAEAYALANGDVSNYGNAMQTNVDTLLESITNQSAEARTQLGLVYGQSIFASTVTIAVSIVAIVIAILIVMRRVIRPITLTQRDLKDIVDGLDNRQGDLTKRVTIISNDEIAALGGGINVFIDKFQQILRMITNNTQKMDVVVNEVLSSVRASNDSVTDLSAMTEELSATMQEVSNSAGIINSNTASVSEDVNDIAEKSQSISQYSIDMKKQADEMESNARRTMEQTGTRINEMMEVLSRSIEESKSVDQVNSLTNDILSISSQTNLLALNASIEAARAGEAGKGFAVVADEIRQLADSSRETANRIQEINSVVVQAVHDLAQNSNDIVDYMNDAVLPEFHKFLESGVQYQEAATYIENVMDEFSHKTDALKAEMDEIAISIETITSAINDGVHGVGSAADDTQKLVEDIANISDRMDENHAISEELQRETAIFVNL